MYSILNSTVKAKDSKYPDLPQFICSNCCRCLKSAHTFVQQAKAVNEKIYLNINDRKLYDSKETGEDKPLDVKVENKEEDLMKEAFENCLQETEIDIENDDVKEENMQQIEDKLELQQNKVFKDNDKM